MSEQAMALPGLYRSLILAGTGHREAPQLIALTTALSAEAMGGWICEPTPQSTLLAGPLRPDHPIESTLLPRRIEDLPAALAYYQVTGANLLQAAHGEARAEGRVCLPRAWRRAAPRSSLRWLAAAVAYESHQVHRAPDRETERSRLKTATAAALDSLGASTLSSLYPDESETSAARTFAARLETILAAPAVDVKQARTEWGDRIAPSIPSVIPLDVLSTRSSFDLSLAQALTHHLVEADTGPKLTHAQAAEALAMERRQEAGTHLARARERIEKAGKKPVSHTLLALQLAEQATAEAQVITKGG